MANNTKDFKTCLMEQAIKIEVDRLEKTKNYKERERIRKFLLSAYSELRNPHLFS